MRKKEKEQLEKLRNLLVVMAIALFIVAGLAFMFGHKIGVKKSYRDFVFYEKECETVNKVLYVYLEDDVYMVKCIDPWGEFVKVVSQEPGVG